MSATIALLLALQAFVVLFLALHDWVPLPPLNDIVAVHAADPRARLLRVTVLSALPFAIGLAASTYFATSRFPGWLHAWLWTSYLLLAAGALRAWWVPYFLLPEPARARRYAAMFGRTHAFLPVHNGIRPNTLHVILHVAIAATLLVLARLPR